MKPGERPGLDAYRQVVGDRRIGELYRLAERLKGKRVQHINSTRVGGGVATLLDRLVPLSADLGLQTSWDVMAGDAELWRVTRKLHDALQGEEVELDEQDLEVYLHWSREDSRTLDVAGDLVFVHDPQPLAIVQAASPPARSGGARRRLIWRCHIDVSTPLPRAWRFVERLLRRYDAAVFSAAQFARELPVPQFVVAPSIDPLSDKNRPLSPSQIRAVLAAHDIDPGRPLLVQVSRFDHWKDPLGVIRAYRMVRETNDCQLALAGGAADDDPEGATVLAEVREEAGDDRDIHVLSLPAGSDMEINALQRAATVVLQKSLREGFGLTVSEALWKSKPVVGGATGGIPLQILDGVNGYLVYSPEGAAFRIRFLLNHPEVALEMGRRGVDMVRQNFLLTRQMREYLMVMNAVLDPGARILEL